MAPAFDGSGGSRIAVHRSCDGLPRRSAVPDAVPMGGACDHDGMSPGLPPMFSAPMATAAGLTRGQRLGSRYTTVSRGVYVTPTRPVTMLMRARALASVLPADAVFSHDTARILLGLPDVGAMTHLVEVTVPAPAGRAPRRRGLRAHAARLQPGEVRCLADVRITSPARTMADLASYLAPEELVALGDAILRTQPAVRTELGRLCADHDHRRGVRALRAALLLLDPRAESVPESRFRVRMSDRGLRPTPQLPVYDAAGRFVARLDFGFDEARVGLEYDGGYHADDRQFQRDLRRHSALVALGWRVLRASRADLADCSGRLLTQFEAMLADAAPARRRDDSSACLRVMPGR